MCASFVCQVESAQIGRQVGHHLGFGPLLRYIGIADTIVSRDMARVTVKLGNTWYQVFPFNDKIADRLHQLLKFSDVIYHQCIAPSTAAEWAADASAAYHALVEVNAPGLCRGGYHHLWVERMWRLLKMTSEKKARTVLFV